MNFVYVADVICFLFSVMLDAHKEERLAEAINMAALVSRMHEFTHYLHLHAQVQIRDRVGGMWNTVEGNWYL